VFELQVAEEILEEIRARDGRFHPHAYLFLLGALEFCQGRRTVRGHIAGDELAWACRDFAYDQFGLTAQTVLSYWGIHSTQDFGRVVYTLVDVGLLASQPEDRIEDFDAVYDFGEAFGGEYPWSGVNRSGGRG
jgi:uncharacterized repeat protein (TIGR04138 family)